MTGKKGEEKKLLKDGKLGRREKSYVGKIEGKKMLQKYWTKKKKNQSDTV